MKRRSDIALPAAGTKEYRKWIAELKTRYRATQIKAAVAVNSAMLEFYWDLGRDIAAMYPGKKRNAHFFENLSDDLCLGIPNPIGLSPSNIRYALRFYEQYRYLQQLAEDNEIANLMKVPWGHHMLLLGKCKGDRDKALFYVRKTIENGWSRTDLQIAIGEEVYEKTGKALTNFGAALPAPSGYLANELIKNEYSFALTETIDNNNERQIEAALVRNITRTLTELGGGFAYVGHQVRVNVGGEDFWPDLIFYHLKSRRYLCIELKAGGFKPEHVGQLGFYMEVTKPMGVARYKWTQCPPKGLAEIKKAADRLGVVVDETFMESELTPKHAAASKGKEVSNG